jgi:hypothetical protein
MILDASLGDAVVTIQIPELVCDLTTDKLRLPAQMLECLTPSSDRSDDVMTSKAGERTERGEAASHGKIVAVTVICDFISLAMHGDVPSSIGSLSKNISRKISYCLNMDQFKAHVLLDGSKLRHACILSHEVDLFESKIVLKDTDTPF